METVKEEKRFGRYISPHTKLLVIIDGGGNTVIDGKVVVGNVVYAEFMDGVFETDNPRIIDYLDTNDQRGRRWYKDESAEERKIGQEKISEIATTFAEVKLAEMDLGNIRTGVSTVANKMAAKDELISATTCPVCSYISKSRFGLMSHMKKHRNASPKLS